MLFWDWQQRKVITQWITNYTDALIMCYKERKNSPTYLNRIESLLDKIKVLEGELLSS